MAVNDKFKNKDVVNPFGLRTKDASICCNTTMILPKKRPPDRRDIDAYLDRVKRYKEMQEKKDEKKLEKVDDIEVIPKESKNGMQKKAKD